MSLTVVVLTCPECDAELTADFARGFVTVPDHRDRRRLETCAATGRVVRCALPAEPPPLEVAAEVIP